MRELASRTEMRELTVRSLLHSAALGHQGDGAAAAMLAHAIDNPLLDRLLQMSSPVLGAESVADPCGLLR